MNSPINFKRLQIAVLALVGLCTAACQTVSTPAGHAQNGKRIAQVEAFFAALAAEDLNLALSFLSDDAILRAPYNPNGDATDDGIRSFPASAYVKGAMATYDNLVWDDKVYRVSDNAETVWIEAEGKLRVAANNTPYENRYVFKIEFSDDQIRMITEYTNVATLARDGVTARAP